MIKKIIKPKQTNVLTMIKKKNTFNQICFRSVHRHYRQTAICISHFTYMKTSIAYGLGLNYVQIKRLYYTKSKSIKIHLNKHEYKNQDVENFGSTFKNQKLTVLGFKPVIQPIRAKNIYKSSSF